MIVTQLLGGLGNQLFQYAIGRAVASRHSTMLALDASRLRGNASRSYALSHFAIQATELSVKESRQLGVPFEQTSWAAKALGRLFRPSHFMPVIRERGFGFDAAALEAPAHCYLQGYWQTPKYFGSVEGLIRGELEVAEPLAGRNLEAAQRIRGTQSVSLHVRRGDYIANPSTREYHGVCSPEYYEAAQKLLLQRLGAIELFVFSDDPDWVAHHLRFLTPATIVRHNGPDQDYEDLRLLSLCRHHIIANSTFSWWGAWLCRHADKVVIAPKRWFQGAGHSTDDLIPPKWIRL